MTESGLQVVVVKIQALGGTEEFQAAQFSAYHRGTTLQIDEVCTQVALNDFYCAMYDLLTAAADKYLYDFLMVVSRISALALHSGELRCQQCWTKIFLCHNSNFFRRY